MPCLQVHRLSFAHGGAAPLFAGVDLRLGPGWHGLAGANGAGKTTLLRLLAGEIRPDAGQVVVVDGTEIAGRKAERVLTNDPGTGVLRHVDAGYDEAKTVAAERGVCIPMADA